MNPARKVSSFICASCRRTNAVQTARTPAAVRQFQTSTSTSAARDQDSIDKRFESVLGGRGGRSRPPTASRFLGSLDDDAPPETYLQYTAMYTPKHKLHVYAHKHNTHITLTAPVPPKDNDTSDPYRAPDPNKVLLSLSSGNIGFRKAGRGTYDAAFQLAAFVTKQIKERGLLGQINDLEVVLRGFGNGREAVTKALLGVEGKHLRGKIRSVVDSTRLKFGGTRSPNPRRLG